MNVSDWKELYSFSILVKIGGVFSLWYVKLCFMTGSVLDVTYYGNKTCLTGFTQEGASLAQCQGTL